MVDADALRYSIATCHRCPLGDLRDSSGTVAVPAEPGSAYRVGGLAILAEAPGLRESQQGRPMVGPAGKTLDEILAAAGLQRADVLLLNRIRCRPPNNKIKSKEGLSALAECDPWLRAELSTYQPGVVLLMGGTAIEIAFGKSPSVGKTRGMVRHTRSEFEYGERTWVATAHPAAILHGDAHWGPLILQDLQLAKEMLR